MLVPGECSQMPPSGDLYLQLLIDTQDQGMDRWRKIKANDILLRSLDLPAVPLPAGGVVRSAQFGCDCGWPG